MDTRPIASVGTGMPVNSFNSAFTNFTGYTPLPTQMPTYHDTYNDPSYSIGKSIGGFLNKTAPSLVPSLLGLKDKASLMAYDNIPNTSAGFAKDVNAVKQFGNSIKTDWGNLTGLEKVSTVGNLLGGAWNAYSANKQLGMQQDAMNLAKKQWQMDWDAKAKITNSELADRQAKRHYSDSKAASVADYMGKYGI